MSLVSATRLSADCDQSRTTADARFHVLDWMAVNPSLQTREAWRERLSGVRHVESNIGSTHDNKPLPSMLRRRITPIGQMALRAAMDLNAPNDARFVFCSRHGEFPRTLALLQTLAKREELSPAEFSLSVHNALAGLLSIAQKNRAGHTAIAAGADSFGFGLIEAISYLSAHSGRCALVVSYDEPLPEPYDELLTHESERFALALLLTSAKGRNETFTVAMEPLSEACIAPKPPCPALDFLSFMHSDASEQVVTGGRMRWRWRRAL